MANIEDIGELFGARVMVNRDDRTIIIVSDDLPSLKFSVDHPCIQGTKIERAARLALAK